MFQRVNSFSSYRGPHFVTKTHEVVIYNRRYVCARIIFALNLLFFQLGVHLVTRVTSPFIRLDRFEIIPRERYFHTRTFATKTQKAGRIHVTHTRCCCLLRSYNVTLVRQEKTHVRDASSLPGIHYNPTTSML